MRTMFVATCLTLVLAVASGAHAQAPRSIPPDLSPAAKVNGLQLAFAPNRGQAPSEVRFQAQSLGGALRFSSDQVQWSLPAASLQQPGGPAHMTLQFQGAQTEPEITGGKRLPGVVNYLIGADPEGWLTHIPTHEDIVYSQLYPGIDLHFAGQQAASGDWSLKGTYTVAPGADPDPHPLALSRSRRCPSRSCDRRSADLPVGRVRSYARRARSRELAGDRRETVTRRKPFRARRRTGRFSSQ